MGQRSRKRRRTGAPRGAGAATVQRAESSSRPGSADSDPPRPRRPSGAERDARIRAELEPLDTGERPGAVTVAAVVAVILAFATMVGYFTHTKVPAQPTASSAVVLAVILLIAAYGLWRSRYWAVLGFQMLLAFQVIIASLSLLVASNLIAVALCLAIIGLGGLLFYKLIRAMARIQMPQREPRPR